jgi:hypothetical protein
MSNLTLLCPQSVHKILKKCNVKYVTSDISSLNNIIHENLEDRKANTVIEPFLYNINSVTNRNDPSMFHSIKKNLVTHRIPVIQLRDILTLSRNKFFYKILRKILTRKYLFLISYNLKLEPIVKPHYVINHLSKIFKLQRTFIEQRVTESLIFFKLFYDNLRLKLVPDTYTKDLIDLFSNISLPQ